MLRGISEHFWLGDGNTLPIPVVRKGEIAIHRINLYPVLPSAKPYLLDSDLSGG